MRQIQQLFMHHFVNNEKELIEHYLQIVNHYFLYKTNSLSGKEFAAQKHLSADYVAVCERKEMMANVWSSLVEELKRRNDVFRIKEPPVSTPHCFEASIALNKQCTVGVNLCLSFLDQEIGFYYVNYKLKHKDSHIVDSYGSYKDYLSYFPSTQLQKTFVQVLKEEILRYFPGFNFFDNEIAAYKIESILGQSSFYKNIDIFQIIFSPYLHGLI